MIKKEEVKNITNLARISLLEEETARLQKEISSILDYFSLLKEADVSNTSPLFFSVKGFNVTREDVFFVNKSEEVKNLFPDMENGYLKVKKIFNE